MLNLRQSNRSGRPSSIDSRAQHFSQISVNFRVPSDFLGNIGEPLDHGQSDRLCDGDYIDGSAVSNEASGQPLPVAEGSNQAGKCSRMAIEHHCEDPSTICGVAHDASDIELELGSIPEVRSIILCCIAVFRQLNELSHRR